MVDTKVARLAVDTKFAKFAVEIRFAKFAVEIRFARLAVEIRFAKFAVETRFAKFAVETKFVRLAVLINPFGIVAFVAEDKYPTVPRPITVLVRFVCERKEMPVIEETLSCCVESIIAVIVFAVIVIVLILVPIVSPVSVNPVPDPIKRAFTVSELIVAVNEFMLAVLIFVVDKDEVRKA